MKRPLLLLALSLLMGSDAYAMCFSVYARGQLVYESTALPVDLSRSLHETVPARFGPGATMVFNDDAECGRGRSMGGRDGAFAASAIAEAGFDRLAQQEATSLAPLRDGRSYERGRQDLSSSSVMPVANTRPSSTASARR